MESKKVSVIVPCYGVEKYLPNCFKSLEGQTYKNLEIIFVNDGSKDNSLKVLQEYCEGKENCIIVDKPNSGVSSARNAGLKKATGDYIYFYDPDDMLNPTMLETLRDLMGKHNADISICGFKRVADGKSYEDYKFKTQKSKIKIFEKKETLSQYLSQNIFDFCVWNKLYKASILKEHNITFIEHCRYGEDTYFNYFYIKNMKNGAVYTSEKLYLYVQRKTSLVHSKFNEKRLDCYYSLNTIVDDSEKNYQEMINYTHSIRSMVACEMLYFIKRGDYNNSKAISEIIRLQKEDAKYLKYCKKISLYRRLLIPLVPGLAKCLLRKRIKNDNGEDLPKSMQKSL